MSLKDYVREKMGWMCGAAVQLLLLAAVGRALQVNSSYIVAVIVLEVLIFGLMWGMEFQKRRSFYNDMFQKLYELDKKFLITEMIKRPGFLEGDLFCEALYEVDKSMNDHISDRERSVREFKDYVEMWIHEIKLPISALSLMYYNEKTDFHSYRKQVDKISYYVEQILYFVRADAPQEDFIMKRCRIDEILNEVLLEHKETLIAGKFTISKKDTDVTVVSDTKWLKFMLGQILNNSIKYKQGETGYLGFEVQEEPNAVTLSIEDHGIGVSEADIKRVFDKSFTGKNGREVASSTGMGLYICRKMCGKLGHRIWMESEEGAYTKVLIRFGRDGYYFGK